MSKNLALWLLVALVAMALFQLMNSQRSAMQEFTYTAFKQQLEAGNVQSVTVYDGRQVEGEFRTPVTQDSRQAKNFSVLLPIANSESFLAELEKAGVPISAKEPKVGIANFLIAALPWIVIIGLWLFLLRQLQAGGSRAFSFGKSKARLLAGDTPKLTFADVAGCDEAKVELQEIIEFLKDPAEVHPPGRTAAQGCPAGRAPGHRQDPARQGRGRRGGAALLLDVGLRLRGNVRRGGRLAGPRPVRAGEGSRALHHLHRRNRRGRTPSRRRIGRRAR